MNVEANNHLFPATSGAVKNFIAALIAFSFLGVNVPH
jgi:hypothetical protein